MVGTSREGPGSYIPEQEIGQRLTESNNVNVLRMCLQGRDVLQPKESLETQCCLTKDWTGALVSLGWVLGGSFA